MKVFFDNCPTCPNGVFETARQELDELCALARDRWGEGRMVRVNGEYIWTKSGDRHGDWRGCCAEKIAGSRGMEPLVCTRCGAATGPAYPVDADHPGWLCPKCYGELQDERDLA